MLKIQASERVFTISKDNLQKADYFNSLLTRWNHDNIITVDEDSRLFRHFLNCLRHPTYQIPDKYANNVFKLLDFYGVKHTKLQQDELRITKCHYLLSGKLSKNTFSFNGRLLDICFNIFRNGRVCFETNVCIWLNKTQILCCDLNPCFLDENNHLKLENIHNIKELEGLFCIEITNNNPYVSGCSVLYSETIKTD